MTIAADEFDDRVARLEEHLIPPTSDDHLLREAEEFLDCKRIANESAGTEGNATSRRCAVRAGNACKYGTTRYST